MFLRRGLQQQIPSQSPTLSRVASDPSCATCFCPHGCQEISQSRIALTLSVGRVRDPQSGTPNPNTSTARAVLRFGLKRGKLLYLFKYPDHDVEREKHRNVITRARFIKASLERAGYTLIPWDFKKASPPTFWEGQQREQQEGLHKEEEHAQRQLHEQIRDVTMEEEDDDLYGPSETVSTGNEAPKTEEHGEGGLEGDSGGDEPMDEGLESGEEEESDSDSVCLPISRYKRNWSLTKASGPRNHHRQTTNSTKSFSVRLIQIL